MKPQPDEVTHLDLNLARLPLVHIRGSKNGAWSFKIDDKLVEGNRRLTRRELAVYAEILSLFEQAKMPEDGSFYTTQNGLARDIVKHSGGTESNQRNIGGFEKKRLKKHLSNIRKTFLSYDGCFKANGVTKTTMIGFSLLEEVNLYERTKDDHFFLSNFRLPKTIVGNMRDGYWKPIKVAIISHFKSEKALALWMLLDRILSVQDEPYNKDLKELCEEIGISFERERDYVAKMKQVCRDVVNVPLTCGKKIKLCHIEESKTSSGYKLIAVRGENKPVGKIVEKRKAPRLDRETEILLDWYKRLPKSETDKIDSRVEDISKELHSGFWRSSISLEEAKIESIRRAYLHDATCIQITDKVNAKLLTLRQPPSQVQYRRTADVVAEMLNFLYPPRLYLTYKAG